ncbi:MAG: TPM domain-containing protein [Rhodanobacteraceae bacterium]
MARWLAHLIARTNASKHFPPATLDAVQHAIAASEDGHLGEICFAVEGGLPIGAVFAGRKSRERAHDVFARLRVWDTDNNTGVLVYILLGDHAIEIVADRGIAARVGQDEWIAICELMQRDFKQGEYQRGAIAGVAAITEILVRHFPSDGKRNPDELPDRPVLL